MTDRDQDGAWFVAKRYGYGAGLPIAWQGWVFSGVQGAAVIGGLALLAKHQVAAIAWTVIVALLPLPLYAAKTRGGWKWRWGTHD
jgi:hypothetical protein